MVSWLTEVPYSSIWKLEENELANVSCGVRKEGGHENLPKLSSRVDEGRLQTPLLALFEAPLYPYNFGKMQLI